MSLNKYMFNKLYFNLYKIKKTLNCITLQETDFCIQGNKTHVQYRNYCRFIFKNLSLFAINQAPLITCVPNVLLYLMLVIVTLTLIIIIRVKCAGNRSIVFVHSLFGG